MLFVVDEEGDLTVVVVSVMIELMLSKKKENQWTLMTKLLLWISLMQSRKMQSSLVTIDEKLSV